MCCCIIETSSVLPRKSSVVFGNFSVIFGKCPKNVRKSSTFPSEFFGRWSEIFGKASKTSSSERFYNKQNITCPLVDMNFIF